MTFEEAKKFFFKYDGSLFAMAREEMVAYENYKLLNISEETLEKWRQELFFNLWEQLKKSGESDLFHRMYNLSENRHDKENLMILKDALHSVNYVNAKVSVSISETVLGRKDLLERSGMIFWAYDLGEEETARELLQFVWGLTKITVSDENTRLRVERIVKNCYLISSKINYSTFPI